VSNLKSHIVRNLELYLVGLSVAVALALPLAIEVGTNDQELAVTALAACVFQGVVLWMMRRRSRRLRAEMIGELRAMLKDRINNHLTIVLMSVTQRRDSRISPLEQEMLQAAISATTAVSRVLDELSMESLRRWKARYEVEIIRTPRDGARASRDASGSKRVVGL
jgi:peptidoglycan biosynthesis protein MviN/MurJ (putative lipid II flippase)